jgi:hypothetical protein
MLIEDPYENGNACRVPRKEKKFLDYWIFSEWSLLIGVIYP